MEPFYYSIMKDLAEFMVSRTIPYEKWLTRFNEVKPNAQRVVGKG